MQTSTAGPAVSNYVSRRTTKGPGFYITFLVFFISVLVSIGMFVYTRIIEASIEDKLAQIERVQAAFDPASMKELIRVDTRMKYAHLLIDGHVTPSEYLRLLEQMTLRNVRYESLSFNTGSAATKPSAQALPEAQTPPSVVLTGQAADFKKIALQADQFALNADVRNPVVSGLNINSEKLAVFSVTMHIDQRLISYTDALRSGRRAVSPTAVPVPVTTPNPTEAPNDTATTSEPTDQP